MSDEVVRCLRTLSRLTAKVIGGLCAVGVSRLPATADRAHDDLDREREDDQISDHLPGDHQPRRLGLGRDVAEPAVESTVTMKYNPSVCVSRPPKLLADIVAMTT